MNFLMIKELINIFECFAALVEEARVLVARDLILQDVRVVSGCERYFDSYFLGILIPVTISSFNLRVWRRLLL